jgi:adenylosuccinate lyase
MMENKWDLVSKLPEDQRRLLEFRLQCLSPDDGKYGNTTAALIPYLSADAEWKGCVKVQQVLLETRVEFGKATEEQYKQFCDVLDLISTLNISLLEGHPKIRHDQLAVLQEIANHVSPEIVALLHPGTTSYDILDTARSWLFKQAWYEVMRPAVCNSIEKLSDLGERSIDILRVGRTHIQDTSPVLVGGTFAGYARRIAERTQKCDAAFDDLRGTISGIVGTGAGIEMVIGEGKALEFQERVLAELGLRPDYAATQIVQKERLADVGNSLVTLIYVVDDFAEDMRKMYSSAIKEVTSRDNKERLGGSSADAMKNNPIDYENIAGTGPIVEGGMRTLYSLIVSDFERDLRGSKGARYQPQLMMAEVYESCVRLNKTLSQLSLNTDRIEANLRPVRENPSEAMVAILRGEAWVHPVYGVGHDFVKEMGKRAQKSGEGLLDTSMKDEHFAGLYADLPTNKRAILRGELENYLGFAKQLAIDNIKYARSTIR